LSVNVFQGYFRKGQKSSDKVIGLALPPIILLLRTFAGMTFFVRFLGQKFRKKTEQLQFYKVFGSLMKSEGLAALRSGIYGKGQVNLLVLRYSHFFVDRSVEKM